MANIRVDQSHCNYHLARYLEQQGWEVLFTDAGRVSRGGTGSQGACLRVFEESSLPIPDIITLCNQHILVIEIDSTFNKASNSLKIYREQQSLIINKLNIYLELEVNIITLLTSFCRTNITREAVRFFLEAEAAFTEIDAWIVFEEARNPMIHWTSSNPCTKG